MNLIAGHDRLPADSAGEESDGFESEPGSDSDRELQVAFEKGLLKSDRLNFGPREARREPVHNVGGLRSALARLSRAELGWLERLDLVVEKPEPEAKIDAAATNIEEDDFARELGFYKQAQMAVRAAIPRLHALKVPTKRPADYYAQMAKTDAHMTRVREKLVDIQAAKKKWETARRLREERKYATKVQKEVLLNRVNEKRKLADAVKKHRKGMKEQLEDVLENRKAAEPGAASGKKNLQKPGIGKKRNFKNTKFGFGGRKKGTKGNDKDSYGFMGAPGHFSGEKSAGGAGGGGGSKGGKGKKGKGRPGKSKRKSGKK